MSTHTIPSHWERLPLGRLATFRNGANFTADSFGMGLKIINVGDFADRSAPDYASLSEVSPAAISSEEALLTDRDIVAVRSNGNRELIGRTMLVKNPPRVTHSAFTIRIRVHSEGLRRILPEYLAYVLRGPSLRSVLTAQGSGTNISNLNQGILSHLPLDLPPLSVQERIVSHLAAYDDLIANNTRRIQILEEMAQAVYREWFVEFRFPGHENVQMVGSELGSIPEGWNVRCLGGVTVLVSRGVSPKYDDESDARVVNQKCIRGGWLSMELSRPHGTQVPQVKQLEVGDVLINSTGTGTLGRVAQVLSPLPKTTVDSHVTIVRPDPAKISADYIGLNLTGREDEFASMATGSTGQTELGRGRISEAYVIVPDMATQQHFSGLVAPMRALSVTLRAQIANLRETRDLLLPRLISGEIDVSNLELGSAEPAA